MNAVLARLTEAFRNDRLPQGLLFHGPAGVGIRPLLLQIAQALVCSQPNGLTPCGVCPDCSMFPHGHPRVFWLLPQVSDEMASRIDAYGPQAILADPWMAAVPPRSAQIPVGGDNLQPTYPLMTAGVRSLAVALGRSEDQRRVVLIPYADALNQSSSNALLKILEEPPAGVHFLLAAPSPDHVLPTIRSRAALISVPTWSRAETADFLAARKVPVERRDEALELAQGRPALALRLSQDAAVARRERAATWLNACLSKDGPDAGLAWIESSPEIASKDRQPVQELLEASLLLLRRRIFTTGKDLDLERLDRWEALRRGTEQAIRDIDNYSKPAMAMARLVLTLHLESSPVV